MSHTATASRNRVISRIELFNVLGSMHTSYQAIGGENWDKFKTYMNSYRISVFLERIKLCEMIDSKSLRTKIERDLFAKRLPEPSVTWHCASSRVIIISFHDKMIINGLFQKRAQHRVTPSLRHLVHAIDSYVTKSGKKAHHNQGTPSVREVPRMSTNT